MDTKVLLGQNSIMKCKVSSDPSVLYQIDWFHNNKYVVILNVKSLFKLVMLYNLLGVLELEIQE